MKDDMVILRAAQAHDPDGSRFRGAIEAHFAWERARGIRDVVVYVLAVLSAPVWLAAVRPHWLPEKIKDLALALWAVSFVGYVMAAMTEWRWQRHLSALTGAASPPAPRRAVAPDSPTQHPDP